MIIIKDTREEARKQYVLIKSLLDSHNERLSYNNTEPVEIEIKIVHTD